MTITNQSLFVGKLHPIWAFAVGVCTLGFTFDLNTYVMLRLSRVTHFVTITVADEVTGVVQRPRRSTASTRWTHKIRTQYGERACGRIFLRQTAWLAAVWRFEISAVILMIKAPHHDHALGGRDSRMKFGRKISCANKGIKCAASCNAL